MKKSKPAKTRGPAPFTQPKRPTISQPNVGSSASSSPHKQARKSLPPIVRAPEEPEFPLVYQNRNKHPRNGQACKESRLVSVPDRMIAIVFEDKTNLVVPREFVQPRKGKE